jgi:hypothetical protein
MARTTPMTVRLGGPASDFVTADAGENGARESFERLKAALTGAFARAGGAPGAAARRLGARPPPRIGARSPMAVRGEEGTSRRIDAICRHTRERRGEARAERHVSGRFAAFAPIEARWRALAAGARGGRRRGMGVPLRAALRLWAAESSPPAHAGEGPVPGDAAG